MPPASAPQRLLVVGFSPETNLGDRARQTGLLQLLRRRGLAGRLPIGIRLGPNQAQRIAADYGELARVADIEIVPLPLPSFDNDGTGLRRVAGEVANAASTTAGLFLLALARVAPRFSVAVWPRRYRRALAAIREADFVVWRGTNIRGRGNALVELYRMYARTFPALLCMAYGRPVAYASGSVWGEFAAPARWLLRQVFRRCAHISVRESASVSNLHALLGAGPGPPILRVPDLSLAVLQDRKRAPAPDLRAHGIEIAVTLMDWDGFGPAARDRYVEAVARFVEERIEAQGASVTIVPQVVKQWESASRIARDVVARIAPSARESVNVIAGGLSVDELVARYRASDLLLATRMHSAIFAWAVGTPVIAIPYDAGAKWQILADLGAGDLMIDYDRVTADALRARFERLQERSDSILGEVGANLDAQFARLDTILEAIPDAVFAGARPTPPRAPSPS